MGPKCFKLWTFFVTLLIFLAISNGFAQSTRFSPAPLQLDIFEEHVTNHLKDEGPAVAGLDHSCISEMTASTPNFSSAGLSEIVDLAPLLQLGTPPQALWMRAPTLQLSVESMIRIFNNPTPKDRWTWDQRKRKWFKISGHSFLAERLVRIRKHLSNQLTDQTYDLLAPEANQKIAELIRLIDTWGPIFNQLSTAKPARQLTQSWVKTLFRHYILGFTSGSNSTPTIVANFKFYKRYVGHQTVWLNIIFDKTPTSPNNFLISQNNENLLSQHGIAIDTLSRGRILRNESTNIPKILISFYPLSASLRAQLKRPDYYDAVIELNAD